MHKLALGFEYSSETFGKKTVLTGNPPKYSGRLTGAGEILEWNTDTVSILGEYQWTMAPNWHLFLGGRADKHRYTDWLLSPRSSLIFTATDRDVLKLLYNRSVLRADDADLRTRILITGDIEEPETIDSVEFRYERQHSSALTFALSGYYSDYDVIGWTFNATRSTQLGNLKLFGIEGEISYQGESLRTTLNHNYTKHKDFDLVDPSVSLQNISASPYPGDFGNDLANWSNHNTKLTFEYRFMPNWRASGSLRVLWGYPGGEDLAEYNRVVKNTATRPYL